MNSSSKIILSELLKDIFAWAVTIGFILYHVAPIFSDRALAGWDLVPHYTLYTRFLSLFKTGNFQGYDFSTLSGYSEFTLYQPLGYLLLAIPNLLTFGAISEQLSFNVSLALLPIIYLVSVYWCSRQFCSRSAARWALWICSIYLASPTDFGMYGMGLFSIFGSGLITSFIAQPLLAIFLGLLERVRTSKQSSATWIMLTLVFALLSLTHLITTVLALVLLSAYLLGISSWGSRIKLSGCTVAGIGLVSLWYISFVRLLPYSSSNTSGLWGPFSDPLFYYFPGVSLKRFEEFWQTRHFPLFPSTLIPSSTTLRGVILPAWLCYFPIAGLTILAGFIAGCRKLVDKRELFLVVLTISLILVLPRNYFTDGSDLGLHFYRFVQGISLLVILITAEGLESLATDLRARSGLFVKTSVALLLVLVAWGFICNNFILLSISRTSPFGERSFHQYTARTRLFQDEYPDYKSAHEMMSFISTLSRRGRVAAECASDDQGRLGSPHTFNSLLPLKYGVSVASGLLLESSPITPLLMPTLYARSKHVQWARRDLAATPEFIKQPLLTMIARMRSYSIEYLLASTDDYQRELLELPDDEIRPIKTVGRKILFEISNPRPITFVTTNKPALFIGTLGEFREFSELWYTSPRLLHTPILFSPSGTSALSPAERGLFGAIIVKPDLYNRIGVVAAKRISEQWGSPIIVFSERDGSVNGVRWIETRQSLEEQIKQLEIQIKDLLGESNATNESEINSNLTGSLIELNGSGLIGTTLGFSPQWHSLDPQQTVFMSSAGTIFVFSDKDTKLVR